MTKDSRMKTAAKTVKKKLTKTEYSPRKPVTVYLDQNLYQAFRKECEELNTPPSTAFEDFMREFLHLGKTK